GESFTFVRTHLAFVPSFGFPWGFITASDTVDARRLTDKEVDDRLATRLTGELKSYDGIAHRGMFSLTKDLRAMLAEPGSILEDATVNAWTDEESVVEVES
ncbi:MAG TPA: hypothetical protein VGZ22_26510, partial [Isosphaeraceae bacterium]|nr:hypothetical protein [Isosphaeraceae bacterium]